MTSRKKIVLAVIITAVVSSLLTLIASSAAGIVMSLRSGDNLSSKLDMIDMILDKRYLYDYDKSEIGEEALSAYVSALNEPYTEYYPRDEYSSYIENLQDGYVGIGIIVSVDDNDRIVVVAPFEDSPAYNAGVEPGDILKSVNGVDYSGSELNEAVNVIRGGKEGTTVDVTILRDGEEISLTIERSDISDESVKVEMLDDNIGYMRITQFNMESENKDHSTSTEFDRKIKELQSEGMERLIIDLRDNPGGIFTEVCNIADELLPEGIITYTEDKNGKRKEVKSDSEYLDIPIAVLINGNSASASEILTGALKDFGRATIVGEKSFGKGIVQDVYSLFDGSGISVTTAKYYTPNGVCIHEIGIEPDIKVEMPEKYKDNYASLVPREEDIQLQKAIEAVKEK